MTRALPYSLVLPGEFEKPAYIAVTYAVGLPCARNIFQSKIFGKNGKLTKIFFFCALLFSNQVFRKTQNHRKVTTISTRKRTATRLSPHISAHTCSQRARAGCAALTCGQRAWAGCRALVAC